jgi:hypothetical protein
MYCTVFTLPVYPITEPLRRQPRVAQKVAWIYGTTSFTFHKKLTIFFSIISIQSPCNVAYETQPEKRSFKVNVPKFMIKIQPSDKFMDRVSINRDFM